MPDQNQRDEYESMARLLGLLFGFAALSVFAEGLYVPLKRLGAGLYRQDMTALAAFHDTVVPLLPALMLLGALWQGRRLFRHLASGELLVPATAGFVRRSGEWIAAAAATGLLVGEIVDGARPGWAFLVGLGAIGLALRSLAGVIDQAARLKADHDQII